MNRTGRCLCGAVSFAARGLLLDDVSACHCGMCLRWTGGPLFAVFVEGLDFERDDALTWFRSSGFAERGFCRKCGSSLFFRITAEGKYQGTTSVCLGSLHDKTGVTVVKEWFIDRKPDCYALEGADGRTCVTEAQVLALLDEPPT